VAQFSVGANIYGGSSTLASGQITRV